MLKIFISWKNDKCLKLTINCIGKQYTHAEQLCEIAMSLWPQSENSQI